MSSTQLNEKKRTISEDQLTIYRQIPGFRRDEGYACVCGIEYISTRRERAFSDSMVYHHRCKNCENEFSTWTEG